MNSTIETVSFNLIPGTTKDAFLAASEAVSAWVERQPGFQYRSLSQKDDGSWIDIVYWASRADAEAANASFKQELGTSDFVKLIDNRTVIMEHSEAVVQQMAKQAA